MPPRLSSGTTASRIYVAIGWALWAGVLLMSYWSAGNPAWKWWKYGLIGGCVLLSVILTVAVLSFMWPSRRRYPARLSVWAGRFEVAGVPPAGLVPVALLPFSAMMLGQVAGDDDLVLAFTGTVAGGITTVLVLIQSVFAWSSPVELTPQALILRIGYFQQSIPWEALAAGGPYRPGMNAPWTELVVTRPELVRRRGLPLGTGSRQRPKVPSSGLEVHPDFLADVIRHYAENPQHRAAIGTQSEYNRLVAELNALSA